MNLKKYMSFLTKISLLPFIIIKKNIKKDDFFWNLLFGIFFGFGHF